MALMGYGTSIPPRAADRYILHSLTLTASNKRGSTWHGVPTWGLPFPAIYCKAASPSEPDKTGHLQTFGPPAARSDYEPAPEAEPRDSFPFTASNARWCGARPITGAAAVP